MSFIRLKIITGKAESMSYVLVKKQGAIRDSRIL